MAVPGREVQSEKFIAERARLTSRASIQESGATEEYQGQRVSFEWQLAQEVLSIVWM